MCSLHSPQTLEVVFAIDCVSVGVDRMPRNFEPIQKQVEAWPRSELTDVTAKVVIHEAFVEGKLEAPKHLARTVPDLYFDPKREEFQSRTIWGLSHALTEAFKELASFSRFRAAAKLAEFLEARFTQSFLGYLAGPAGPPILGTLFSRQAEVTLGTFVRSGSESDTPAIIGKR